MNTPESLQERRTGWKLGPTDARTEYEVDFARVVHSGSFRRLQGKTQILNLGDSDFYRTRLTHSLEVAQIASGIVRTLKRRASDHPAHSLLPSESLIQAICLAHDLGHPPFGHGGEVALNYCMREHGGFEGNGQTLRISSRLEHFSDRHGYDFTRRATLGVLKYPTAYSEVVNPEIQPSLISRITSVDIIDRGKSKPPKCYFESERDVVDWALRATPDDDIKKFKEIVKEDGKHGKAIHKSLDASIMDIADDIAYGIHDLEDVIALHLISERDFRTMVKKDVCRPFLDFLRLKCGEADPYEHFILSLFGDGNERKRCISRLVGVMVNAAVLITKDEFNDTILRHRVNIIDEHRILLDELQHVVVELVIKSPNVQHLEFKGQSMVIAVFDALASDPKLLLPRDAFQEYEHADQSFRAICDFVAGMTDGYLLRTFERLFSPRMGSVFDKL
jgi:dGTPase